MGQITVQVADNVPTVLFKYNEGGLGIDLDIPGRTLSVSRDDDELVVSFPWLAEDMEYSGWLPEGQSWQVPDLRPPVIFRNEKVSGVEAA